MPRRPWLVAQPRTHALALSLASAGMRVWVSLYHLTASISSLYLPSAGRPHLTWPSTSSTSPCKISLAEKREFNERSEPLPGDEVIERELP